MIDLIAATPYRAVYVGTFPLFHLCALLSLSLHWGKAHIHLPPGIVSLYYQWM